MLKLERVIVFACISVAIIGLVIHLGLELEHDKCKARCRPYQHELIDEACICYDEDLHLGDAPSGGSGGAFE